MLNTYSRMHVLPLLLFALLIGCNRNQNNNQTSTADGLTTRVVVNNLNIPWELIWGPDNLIWMTERNGKVSKVNPSNGNITPLLTISEVKSINEGGMLGMVLHPDFNNNPQVFIAYNYDNGGNYREKIVRYTYNGTTLVNPFIILDNIAGASIHNGCRMVISSDLKLFITTGDASSSSLSQNNASVNGKVLRLNLDGTIPADNPNPSSPVWSWGHRNAQGLVYVNSILFSSEHGAGTDDEINIVEKGRNYGWPTVEGLCDESGEQNFCTTNNVKQPLKVWTPTLAVCGLDYYNKDLIPQWKNSLLMCTLKASRLVQLKLNDANNQITETKEFFDRDYGRLRDLCISPDGKVYICTSNGGGNDRIVEISSQ